MPFLPNWLTGYDPANADAVNAKQAQLAAREAAARANGNVMLADYYNRGFGPGAGADYLADEAEIDQTFADSVKENAENMSKGVRDTLNFSLGKILGAVPWWVYLAGAFALFIYLGGGAVLRSRVAKLA